MFSVISTRTGPCRRRSTAKFSQSRFASPIFGLAAYRAPWSGAAGQAAYYRFVGQMADEEFARAEAAVSGIEVPTLILWGAEDRWTAPERGDFLERLILDSRQVRVPGGGHFVMDDEPGAVADALVRFFDEI
jgi:pimeloyl-ACP methyl ester carboxylesterase